MIEPVRKRVQCASPSGLHWMSYLEWGAADNPRTVVCVHGLTRNGRDFDALAQELAGASEPAKRSRRRECALA